MQSALRTLGRLYRRYRTPVLILLIVALSAAAVASPRININLGPLHLVRASEGPLGLTLGLDLQGGIHLVYEAAIPDVTSDQMDGVVSVINRRINAFGVTEAVVQKMGGNRVLVQLPGVHDVEEAKRLIGQTARLEFKLRECQDPACTQFVDKEIGLTGDDLARAFPSTDQVTGEPVVSIQFNDRGARIFGDITRQIAGDNSKRIAIFLDNQELLAPVVLEPILTGQSIIRGPDFTPERVRTLAIQLESGRLPVPLRLIQETDVDALLGSQSLKASAMAGLVGLLLLMVFMVAYYRVPGLVASAALITYGVIVLAVFKLIPVTLTLPGIAGFIVSLGMAVDANVLIFERLKEELQGGRPLLSSIDVGFSRAWSAIWDSNVTTFITTGILYWFGSQTGATIVTGFALTLFIGVATSMFTAYFVSKGLLMLVGRTPVGRYVSLFSPIPVRKATAVPATPGGE